MNKADSIVHFWRFGDGAKQILKHQEEAERPRKPTNISDLIADAVESRKRAHKHWSRIVRQMEHDLPILEAKRASFEGPGAIDHMLEFARKRLEEARAELSRL